MKTLTEIQLYLILIWASAQIKKGHWDTTTLGRLTELEIDNLYTELLIEIRNRGYSIEVFREKYCKIFKEAPDGHYIPN